MFFICVFFILLVICRKRSFTIFIRKQISKPFTSHKSINMTTLDNLASLHSENAFRAIVSPRKETTSNNSRIFAVFWWRISEGGSAISSILLQREWRRNCRIPIRQENIHGITAVILSFFWSYCLSTVFNLDLPRAQDLSSFAPLPLRRTKPHCRKLESLPLTVESFSSLHDRADTRRPTSS